MEITLNYDGTELKYQCNDMKDKINDIFHQCRNDIDLNKIIFLYNGKPIDGNLSISKIINRVDMERNKMNIIVTEKKDESKPCIKYSKDIICPKCGEYGKLDITEYKIIIQCIKGHNMGNILLNEYKDTQKIDISKIICDECKINNKSESYNNIFYRCNECNNNLCIQCKNKHEHNCINYDDKNYLCDKHNYQYYSYCKKCNKNICIYCKNEHKEHELINYDNIIPDINEVKNNLNKLRKDINEYKEIINEIINKLNVIKNNIEYYYNKSIRY